IHGVRLYYKIGTYAGAFRLDNRFLPIQTSNSNSVNGALFIRFLATQLYKVRPYTRYIDGANQPGAIRLVARFLHNQTSDSNSVNGTLFIGLLARQLYRVCPYAIDIHGVPFYCAIGTYASAFRLDTRFLPSQMSNSNSVNRVLFTKFPATQPYKVCPYAMYIDSANQLGTFRLNARFLHHHMSYSDSAIGTFVTLFLV